MKFIPQLRSGSILAHSQCVSQRGATIGVDTRQRPALGDKAVRYKRYPVFWLTAKSSSWSSAGIGRTLLRRISQAGSGDSGQTLPRAEKVHPRGLSEPGRMKLWKFFGVLGAALGTLAALDDSWQTDAELMTPPVHYVSPWYVSPNADFLWVIALILGSGCWVMARRAKDAAAGPD